MKRIIFLLPILLLVSTFSNAQINCGSQPSAQYLQDLDNQVANKSGCLDSFDLYDLEAFMTFNLVLSYAKFGTGVGEFDQDDLDDIEDDINDVYNDQNIYFNIIWNNMDCDACLDNFNNWPNSLP